MHISGVRTTNNNRNENSADCTSRESVSASALTCFPRASKKSTPSAANAECTLNGSSP